MLPYLHQAGITDAERRGAPYTGSENLSTRRVVVIPRNRAKERGSRAADIKVYWVEIHVQHQIDPSNIRDLDNLISTVEDVWALWEESGSLRDESLAGCKWTGEDDGIEFEDDEIYDVETLRDDGVFSSVTLLRYRRDS